jgi:hypothetical protein
MTQNCHALDHIAPTKLPALGEIVSLLIAQPISSLINCCFGEQKIRRRHIFGVNVVPLVLIPIDREGLTKLKHHVQQARNLNRSGEHLKSKGPVHSRGTINPDEGVGAFWVCLYI